jgi:flagellar hook assembly protein FlgD
LGKKVMTLVNEKQSAGVYSLIWNGKDQAGNEAASGVYFCRLSVKRKNFDYSFSRKMVKLQ